jgi:trimeric autotransporter adhesin
MKNPRNTGITKQVGPRFASALLAVAIAVAPTTIWAQRISAQSNSNASNPALSSVVSNRAGQAELAKLDILPGAAQSYISGSVGADLRAYHIEARANGFHAESRGLASDFSAQGVEISHESAHLRLALDSYGHGDTLNKVSAASAKRVSANRVEYQRRGLTEWYANGPLGLEQGFTVDQPEKNTTGPLTVALAIAGNLTATVEQGGKGMSLSGRDSKQQFGYSGLFSTDADGKELPSRLEMAGNRLLIKVDDAGARYPVTIDPTWVNYTLDTTFNHFVPVDDAGVSVAVDFIPAQHDYVVVVGARGATQPTTIGGNGSTSGVAYVFESLGCINAPSCWTRHTLYPSDGQSGDFFGGSVSIDNNWYSTWNGKTIAVGASSHTVAGNAAAGEAYVFVKPGATWLNHHETTKLTNGTGQPGVEFGFAVSVSSNMVVVGEPQPYSCASCTAGAAYIYKKPSTWPATMAVPTSTLTTPVLPNGSEFGFSVSISSYGGGNVPGVAIVGAPQPPGFGGCNCGPGSAYIYQEPSGGWTATTPITATLNNPYPTNDWFGFSVSMSIGTWAAVGAPNATCDPSIESTCPSGYPAQTGLAYQFAGWPTTTSPSVTMYPSDGQTGDLFGFAVSTNGKGAPNVAVGAPFHSKGSRQGKGYFFEGAWTQTWPYVEIESQSVAPTSADAEFGWSVSSYQISPSLAVFGAPASHSYAGAAYFYYKP